MHIQMHIRLCLYACMHIQMHIKLCVLTICMHRIPDFVEVEMHTELHFGRNLADLHELVNLVSSCIKLGRCQIEIVQNIDDFAKQIHIQENSDKLIQIRPPSRDRRVR